MSWSDIFTINPKLVALAGAFKAMTNLKDDQIVTLDGQEKLIYAGSYPQRNKSGE